MSILNRRTKNEIIDLIKKTTRSKNFILDIEEKTIDEIYIAMADMGYQRKLVKNIKYNPNKINSRSLIYKYYDINNVEICCYGQELKFLKKLRNIYLDYKQYDSWM